MELSKKEEAVKKAQAKVVAAKKKAKGLEIERQKKINPPPQYFEEPEYTDDDLENEEALLDEVQAGFRKRAKDEGKRFRMATDTEYWCAFCFQTREQKEAFLKALQLTEINDKYIDGIKAAEVLGVDLPEADVPYNTSSKRDKTWEQFV